MAPAAELPESEADGAAAAAAPAGGAGQAAGMVKVELEDPEKAAAAAAAEATEEAADYGGPGADEPPAAPAEAAGPLRAMPDYGDLIDDADGGQRPPPVRGAVKPEDIDTKAEPRPIAIHVYGVQRLTRSHLEEVFSAKGLPLFVRIEWLSDDNVLCIFRSAEEATSVLAGLRTGFDDAVTPNDAPPGPGLWRAQRSMLEFREATTADVPDPTNRRLHRAGRQVREFRFWEAMKDQTRTILDAEESKVGHKRPLPSGEDAIAAAEWDDFGAPPGKRRRVGQAAMSDEEPIDMLEEMAKQDKVILTKTEEGDIQASKLSNDTSLVNPPIEEETWATGRWREGSGNWGGWGRQDNSGWRSNNRGGSWQHDDRRGSWQGGGGNWVAGGDARKRRRDPKGPSRGAAEVLGAEPAKDLDEEERAKRARRGDRFGVSRGGPGDGAPIAAKEEIPAQ
uniref:Uncharacterized protein n=1 Tax=Alexandrium catenella TaxID=2925 RepID=A0A7S1MM38_ALECA|mmetsp:Transcript_29704/g.80309  ORF Transcript_29704/g.80309 Transcript_29704/m.80309 type:complete len:450 (+) Transcript_29704:78-1427(+)